MPHCQTPVSHGFHRPYLQQRDSRFPRYNPRPQRPMPRRCAGSGGGRKNPNPISPAGVSQIHRFSLMDHGGTNESADIYLRGKEENTTAAWCGATALGSAWNTGEKMDSKKNTTMKRLFRAKNASLRDGNDFLWKRSLKKSSYSHIIVFFFVSLIHMNLNKRKLNRFQGVKCVV